MSESPYAIPAEELLAPVPATEQVESVAEPRQPVAGPSGDPVPYGDGMAGDADGD